MAATGLSKTGVFEGKRFAGIVSHVGLSSVRATLLGASGSAEPGGSEMAAPDVGDFVLIACGEFAIFGQMLDVQIPELSPQKMGRSGGAGADLYPVARIQLLTSINLRTGQIVPGVSAHPRVGNKVYGAPAEIVSAVAETRFRRDGKKEEVVLSFARMVNVQNTLVSFTPEMLFGRHCALLGSTGSGKSWSIARLVEETARFRSKVILLDATGEFRSLGRGTRHLHIGHDPNPGSNSEEVALPYNQLTERDLFAIFRPRGQSQAPKLRAAMKSLKLVKLSPTLSLDGTILKANKSKDKFESAYKKFSSQVEDPTADFDITRLTRQIENECVRPNRSALEPNVWGDINGGDLAACVPLVTRVSDIVQSDSLAPIFAPGEKCSLIDEIDAFLEDPEAKVLRVSMQYLSFAHSAREIVGNAVGRHLLGLAREDRFKKYPLLVVLDEAHQFLNKSLSGDEGEYPLDSFDIIAKEGRKYCLSIAISTQRPRDIPEGVLSQMGTLVVHRLINDQDRKVIERASSEMDAASLASLPTLAPGEAVIIGIDFPVPLSIRVEKPDAEPYSEGPNFQKYWR